MNVCTYLDGLTINAVCQTPRESLRNESMYLLRPSDENTISKALRVPQNESICLCKLSDVCQNL